MFVYHIISPQICLHIEEHNIGQLDQHQHLQYHVALTLLGYASPEVSHCIFDLAKQHKIYSGVSLTQTRGDCANLFLLKGICVKQNQ